jgi:hypothetical protein
MARSLLHAGEGGRAEFLRRRVERPRLADMAEDFGLLAAELERCFGEATSPTAPSLAPGGTRVINSAAVRGGGTMPTRAQLRATARTDLEKAIAAHGGPAAVAKRLGWRLGYKVGSIFCIDVNRLGCSRDDGMVTHTRS